MASISTAIGLERLSRISGYQITKGNFSDTTPNLPMNIAILGEANTDKQSGLSTTKKEITSAKNAGELYGYGSPIHKIMRILRPSSSDGVGGVPTVVFPLATPVGSTESAIDFAVTGTATKNGVHTIVINGRRSIDFKSYDVNIVAGDTPILISAKYTAAINDALSCSVSATTDGVSSIELKSKSKGISSVFNAYIDINDNEIGVSYAETSNIPGTGSPDISSALSQFGNDHHTIVVNPYIDKLTDLEVFNGTPENADGRYSPSDFKPFVSLFGSVEQDKDALAAVTNAAARIDQTTNILCAAPNSKATAHEIAASYALDFAVVAQKTPHLDINDNSLSDIAIPTDGNIGDMADYNNRDFLVKKGCSTVVLENSAYSVQDFVTTYHPDGENPLQYSYGRNLVIDWNIKFGYDALEKVNVRDHVIVEDGQNTSAVSSVSPKQWKAVLFDYFDDLAVRGLIREPEFSKASLLVQVSPTNPNRFETFFRYKRTGLARIESTTVEAGF